MFSSSTTPKSKRPEPVFRTPMTYSPRIVANKHVPSPSRTELWRQQLGLDDDFTPAYISSDDDDKGSGNDKENEERISAVEYHTLQRQLEERNSQRDELLFKIKSLSDKNKQYKQKLEKEETTKKQQMKFLCKTQEISLLEKDSLISNLESVVEEQGNRLANLEKEVNGHDKQASHYEYTAVLKLVDDIKRLQAEKAKVTKTLEVLQSEVQSHKCSSTPGDNSQHKVIAKLEKENKEMQEELQKYHKNIQQPPDISPCHTDAEKQADKLQQDNNQLQDEIEELHKSQKQSTEVLSQSLQQQKILEEEDKKLKLKVKKLQKDMELKKEEMDREQTVHRKELTKAVEENRQNSKRMRDLMVELTQLQAKEPEVVTKIKVVEVQVESEDLKGKLKNCEQERDHARAKFDELHIRYSNVKAQLEQEQTFGEAQSTENSELKETISNLRQEYEAKLRHAVREKEEAVIATRRQMEASFESLQTRYQEVCEQLEVLNETCQELMQSYVTVRKQVKQFPVIIKQVVSQVRKQTCEAIDNIDAYNKDLVRKYHREMHLRKKYHNEIVELKGNIRVFCRVRPKIKEDGAGPNSQVVVDYDGDDDGLIYVLNKNRTQTFEVDKVFTETSTQEQVFGEVSSLVTSCIDGFNVCIFAYGQTGSGKTYTMEGTSKNPGINQQALRELFRGIEEKGQEWLYHVSVSVMEIYNEIIRDLLSDDPNTKMDVKINPEGGGLYIPGLCSVEVGSVQDVNQVFSLGQKNRATASTNMNEHSSRSHALLCVTVTGINKTTNTKTIGKLNLVDLAGSERVSKSGADGTRLKEAQNINKSLSSLGDVIFALRSKNSHIPYRNSKLTYLLQDSLGGDSKTLMIVQVAPVEKNVSETLCSLNFAQRVRTVELGQASRRVEMDEGDDNSPGTPNKMSTPSKLGGVYSTPTRATSGTPMSKCATPSSANKLTPIRNQYRK